MADIGHGTTLGILNGTIYNNIGKITNVSISGMGVNPVETTNMDSTNAVQEFIGGIVKAGQVTFDTNADIDSAADTTNYYSSLVTAKTNQTASTFKVTFPNSVNVIFSAILDDFSINAPTESAISTSVSLQISGGVTWSDT